MKYCFINEGCVFCIRAAATDMRYSERSKFFGNLVHKKNLVWYGKQFSSQDTYCDVGGIYLFWVWNPPKTVPSQFEKGGRLGMGLVIPTRRKRAYYRNQIWLVSAQQLEEQSTKVARSLNELEEKSQGTIILRKFLNKP